MLRHAGNRHPTQYFRDRGLQRLGHLLTAQQFDLEEENLRYEFGSDETRIELRFRGEAVLRAVWPEEEDVEPPFFYVLDRHQQPIRRAGGVREVFPRVGTVPILTPIDYRERRRTRDTVIRQLSGRLASRHFRNQLLLLQETPSATHKSALEEYYDFCRTWLRRFG